MMEIKQTSAREGKTPRASERSNGECYDCDKWKVTSAARASRQTGAETLSETPHFVMASRYY